MYFSTLCIRSFLTTIGYGQSLPKLTFEDNNATISQVIKDCLTPQARPLDVLITSLHDHHKRGTFKIASCSTKLMLADYNSKPLSGDILLDKILWSIGSRFYPPKNTDHHIELELDKYPVGKQTQNSLTIQSQLSSNNKTITQTQPQTQSLGNFVFEVGLFGFADLLNIWEDVVL
jgi:hypothetical protein